ncbi:hypothetical protein [Helicobacter felis]|uniref:hypothetical protein n=1 Tax=Helicobacter felis TaxID=214 RepID=UPI001315389E|nr:hypothetical protein [Helicobacter felis]
MSPQNVVVVAQNVAKMLFFHPLADPCSAGLRTKKKNAYKYINKFITKSYARAHAGRAKKKVLRSLESECSAGALLTERLQAGEKPPHPPLAFEIKINTLEWLQIALV